MADFPVSFTDWESRAKERLGEERFSYVAAGAGSGSTMLANVEALARWKLIPRVLRSTGDRSTSTSVLGQAVSTPLMLAPVRGLSYLREKGEELSAKAAADRDVAMVLSNLASATPEAIAQLMGKTPRYFQLYPCSDHEIMRSFVRRAEQAGFRGLMMTVDMPPRVIQYSGPRTNEYENHGNEVYLSDPVFVSRLKRPPKEDRQAALDLIRTIRKAQFTWDDVAQVRETTRLPVVLKGVLNPEDAKEAIKRNAQGIVVSNHGGRSLDGEIAPADVLHEVREAVGSALTIFYDGGIRSGSDVIKVLALGADAVMVGRAFVYALAVGGEEGVKSMLQTMTREMDTVMAACGCRSVGELDASFVRRV